MDNEAEAMARPWLTEILQDLADAAADIAASHSSPLDRHPFTPYFVSPLAEGADQLGATVALELGYRLQAILPLPPDDYRTDFDAAGLAGFDALLRRADTILELPPQNGGRSESYALAGRATIEHSDVLIALWDGEPARGVGGTAEVVSLALQSDIPVIHLTIPSEEPGRILWTGYGSWADPSDAEAAPSRPIDRESLRALIFALVDPGSTAADISR
jgi:hypothetical protein